MHVVPLQVSYAVNSVVVVPAHAWAQVSAAVPVLVE
jgi:hypothetical protein